MNYLRQAAQLLQQKMERDASEVVMYHRKGIPPFEVVAIVGRTVVENDSGTGFIVRTTTRDFTISVEQLARWLGGATEPLRNDRISQRVGAEEHFYTVGTTGPGPHFEEVDGYGIAYRIHTLRDKVTPNA